VPLMAAAVQEAAAPSGSARNGGGAEVAQRVGCVQRPEGARTAGPALMPAWPGSDGDPDKVPSMNHSLVVESDGGGDPSSRWLSACGNLA
jgi:hypothetical protein